MEPWQQNKLYAALVKIAQALDISDTILRMKAANLFDVDDEQLILNDSVHKTDSEKRQKIVELMTRRGPNAYWHFCHIIQDKLPDVFKQLHSENAKAECEICMGQVEEDFKKCNSCSGLAKVFSNPKAGIFVENACDILNLYDKKEAELKGFKNVMLEQSSHLRKLSQEKTLLSNQHLNDIQLRDYIIKEQKEQNQSLLKLTRQLENQNLKLFQEVKELHEKLQNQSVAGPVEPHTRSYDDANKELQATYTNLSIENIALKHKIKLIEKEKSESESNLSFLELQLNTSIDDINNLHEELDVTNLRNTELESIITTLNEKYETKEKLLQQVKEELAQKETYISTESSEPYYFEFSNSKKQAETYSANPLEYEVELERVDGGFGLDVIPSQVPVLLGESQIVIQTAFQKNGVYIRKGDYILKVNEVNVSEYNLQQFESLVNQVGDKFMMTLRTAKKIEDCNIKLKNLVCEHFSDIGIHLAVYMHVTHNSDGYDIGFREFDQILKVNKKNVREMSLADIEKKIVKSSKETRGGVVVKRRQRNDIKRSISLCSSFSDCSLNSSLSSTLDFDTSSLTKKTLRTSKAIPHAYINNDKLFPEPNQTDLDAKATRSSSDLSKSATRFTSLERTFEKGSYSYVHTELNYPTTDTQPAQNTRDFLCAKHWFELFAIQLIGGNNVGIFVNNLQLHPTEFCPFRVGDEIVEIDLQPVKGLALYFVKQLIKQSKLQLMVKVRSTTDVQLDFIRNLKNWDSFKLKTLVIYRGMFSTELSYVRGDVLRVIDSNVETAHGVMWKAENVIEQKNGLIPTFLNEYTDGKAKTIDDMYEFMTGVSKPSEIWF